MNGPSGDDGYRSFFDRVPVGLFRSTPEGRLLDGNPALLRILGYPDLDTLQELSLFELYVNPEQRQDHMTALERDGHLDDVESLLRRADDGIIWVRERAGAVRGPDGSVAYFEGSLVDITDRVRTADRLLRSESRYRHLVEHQVEGLVITDLHEEVVFCNPAAERLFGVGPGGLVGRSLGEFTAPDTLEFLRDQTRKRKRGETSKYRVDISRPDGDVRTLTAHAAPWMADGRSQVQGAFATFSDITEQVRAERALHEAQDRFTRFSEAVDDIIFRFDPAADRFDFVSPSFERQTGYPLEQVLADPTGLMMRIVHPDDLDGYRSSLMSLEVPGPRTLEYRIVRPDGSILWVSDTRIVEQDDTGRPTRINGVVRNVTERVRAEEEARQMQAQLVQAQKLEAIGTLAGGIAHDFNNLLTAIEGFTSLASERVADDHPLLDDLRQVEGAVARAASLTRQLLLFGRKQPLRPEEVGINQVVRELLAMLERLIGEDISIEAELTSGLWAVVVDKPSLEQVVVNLAVNARDAMPDGGQLCISTRNESADQTTPPAGIEAADSVVLEVSDTGTGIDAAHLDQIFDPFFTTKEAGKGTGIGLSVVYGILRQHGGWVEVDSKPGQGTCFRVHLPARRDLTEYTPPRATPRRRSAPRTQGAGQRILVVEDETMVLRFTRRALVGSGYHVLTATTGAQARAILEQEADQLDLLFSDVVLPDTTGVDLAEWIRTAHPELRVLLSSGYMDHKSQWPRIHQLGLPFLQKPYALVELLTAVQDAMDGVQ